MLMAESNAVTTRKPKKLPAIVNHDQLLKMGNKTGTDPMLKCMQVSGQPKHSKPKYSLLETEILPTLDTRP